MGGFLLSISHGTLCDQQHKDVFLSSSSISQPQSQPTPTTIPHLLPHVPPPSPTILRTLASNTLLCRPSFGLPSAPPLAFAIALRNWARSAIFSARCFSASSRACWRAAAWAFFCAASWASFAKGEGRGRLGRREGEGVGSVDSSCSCFRRSGWGASVGSGAGEGAWLVSSSWSRS